MILHLPDPNTARQWCMSQRWDGHSIGYVPTMGALHEGHMSLIRRSLEENDLTCVSIFVNPLQFDDPGDLALYPNDLRKDIEMLDQIGCDMVYVGELHEFFPELANNTSIGGNGAKGIKLENAGAVAMGLEGEHRPGHLDGVRTIVSRLFQTVGPCRAYFGEKDFQQTLVVKELAQELGYPEIIVCPVSREASGLARSSRNVRLSNEQRKLAGTIYQALTNAKQRWENGERSATELNKAMRSTLKVAGIKIEYAEVRDPAKWSAKSPRGRLQRAQALIAVQIGNVRLIDNMRLDRAVQSGTAVDSVAQTDSALTMSQNS